MVSHAMRWARRTRYLLGAGAVSVPSVAAATGSFPGVDDPMAPWFIGAVLAAGAWLIQRWMDRVERRLDEHGRRLDHLEREMQQRTGEIEVLAARIDGRLNTVVERMEAIAETVGAPTRRAG